MYLPGKRARRIVLPLYQPPDVEPNPQGSHEQRQAWMRRRQALGKGGKRREFPRTFHVTALVDPPSPQSKISRHPNSIIVKLAEQLRTEGVL